MAIFLACPDLPAALTSGSTIVLPNQLLASVANEQSIQTHLHSGQTAWRRPAIYSVGAWLTNTWQQARYAGTTVSTLLSPVQERTVWQELIEAEHPQLFDYQSAVSLAMAATRLLAEWHISTEGELWSTASDLRDFQHLHQLFRRRAAQEGWLTRSDLWRLLPDWIGQPWWDARAITFTAFPLVPPALQAITNRLGERAQFAPVRLPPIRNRRAPLFEFQDLAQELEWAARWARQRYEETPAHSLALLLPNLATHRSAVHRALHHVFYSGSGLQAQSTESIFHLHAGEPLRNHPLVASALLLLQLATPRINIADAGAILRSPFIAGAPAERSERAQADAQLRRHRDLDVTLSDIEAASSSCLRLSPIWKATRLLIRGMPDRWPFAQWSEFFAHLLSAAGWPGDAELTRAEQQIVEDWKSGLTHLAGLRLVSPPAGLQSALSRLESLLSTRTFATGDLASPLQVLDASSAYGLRFDAAVLAGLSEDAWPPPHRFSPFIPLLLQRPHVAATAKDRAASTESLFATAADLWATHSGHAAPAIAAFVRRKKNDFPVWKGSSAGQAAPLFAAEDSIDDDKAPPFQVLGTSAPGGVSILKSQSQCPFQAFAKYRLAARRPEDACFGFDARERGSFLHRALENVWRELKTRDQLKATTTSDRRTLIHAAVVAAIGHHDDSPFHQLASEAERERLEEVILEWLAIEEAREQSFTVEHIEKDQSLQIAGLPLNLRIDRVDRLRNGSAVLIDYKSGEPKLKSLEGDRPAEPQLLVYANAMQEPVEGLFFAQLKPRALKAVGWSRTTQFPVSGRARKNIRPDWYDFLQASNEAVENIASEFMEGRAAVDPQPGACTFCDLKALCRINEQAGSTEDADDSD